MPENCQFLMWNHLWWPCDPIMFTSCSMETFSKRIHEDIVVIEYCGNTHEVSAKVLGRVAEDHVMSLIILRVSGGCLSILKRVLASSDCRCRIVHVRLRGDMIEECYGDGGDGIAYQGSIEYLQLDVRHPVPNVNLFLGDILQGIRHSLRVLRVFNPPFRRAHSRS